MDESRPGDDAPPSPEQSPGENQPFAETRPPGESRAVDETLTGGRHALRDELPPSPYPRDRPSLPPSADPEHAPPALVANGGRRARRRRSLLLARALVAIVSAIALIGTGVVWATVNWFQQSANTTDVLADLGPDEHPPPANDGATDILLVGSDTRTDAQGVPLPPDVLKALRTEASGGLNTDTIIVLRIPHDGSRATAISIPRDTYTAIPGMPDNKINSAYGLTRQRVLNKLQATGGRSEAEQVRLADKAGQRALIRSVQDLTEIHVDHYAEISLYGFYLLTKAVGGVPVCLRNATVDKNSGADFAAGAQTVSGSDALAFVRQRDNLPRGDLDRIVRQQTFLAAAAKKVLSAGTLTSPRRLAGLVRVIEKSLTLDDGLDILSFVQQAQSLVSGDVEFVTIPVTDLNGTSPTGQSIVTVNREQVRAFVASTVHDGTASAPQPPPSTQQPAATSDPAPSPAPSPAPATPAPRPDPPVQRVKDEQPTPPVTVDGVRCID